MDNRPKTYRQWKEPGSYQLVGLYDAHLDPADEYFHPAYAVARKYVLDIKPRILLLGGDMGTFDSLSSWNDKKPLIAEGKRYSEDYKVVKDELIYYRHHLPKTRIIYLMGNHEERVTWFVQKQPAMYEHMDLIKDLKLKELGIEWVDFNKHISIGKTSYAHGWNWNMYHAKKTLMEFSDNIIYGHVHHWQVETRNVHFDRRPQAAIAVPCLTDRYPEYRSNAPTRHQNGFLTVDYRKDGTYNPYVHMIFDGCFSHGGRTWRA
jgi:predicted MPP superfamily phosphohydrolase